MANEANGKVVWSHLVWLRSPIERRGRGPTSDGVGPRLVFAAALPRCALDCPAMKRSPTLAVLVHCPHHQRTVRAQRNTAIDRLVSCDEAEGCRDPKAQASSPGEPAKSFPHGCAVYPSLAK